MRKKAFTLFGVIVFVAAGFGVAHALGSYWSSFKNAFPTSPLTQAPLANASGQNCLVCHIGWPQTAPSVSTVNSFGNAYAGGGYVFDAALGAADSDGDGYSNAAEIAAGTFPGDPGSHPTATDTTPPTIGSFVVPASSTSLTVSVSMSATDNVSVTGYMVTSTSTPPLASATGWTAAAPTSYTFSTAGAKTLYGWAKDGAGNVSVPASAALTITLPDSTPPTVTSFVVPASSTSLTVSVSMSATDNVSVTGYMVTGTSTPPLASATGWTATPPTAFTFTSAGVKAIYGWAKDGAGNVSVPASGTVTVTLADAAPPTITSFTVPASSTSLTVSVSMSATDNVSVTGYMVTESATAPLASATGWTAAAPTSYTFSTAGIKTLHGYAKDGSGNVSVPANATVTITQSDTMPPSVTSFIVPTSSSSLTVPVTISATDNVGVTGYIITETSTVPAVSATGWTLTPPASYTFGSAGGKTLYGWAKDAAGNVSASMSQTLTVTVSDSTPPTITRFAVTPVPSSLTCSITLTATDAQGVTGYLVSNSPTKPSATDARWTSTAPTSYTFKSAGNKTLYGWAKDGAGNISARATRSVTIRYTGPIGEEDEGGHDNHSRRSDSSSRDD